jgi:hypothetical protein
MIPHLKDRIGLELVVSAESVIQADDLPGL